MGGILHALMGHRAGGRGWQLARGGRGPHGEEQTAKARTETLSPFAFLTAFARLLAPAAAIRRTIIRHLILLLDLSAAMMDRDMRPTRFHLSLQYTREFVVEWFDQNPLGQIGVVGMRGGIGERIGEMSGTVVSRFAAFPFTLVCR